MKLDIQYGSKTAKLINAKFAHENGGVKIIGIWQGKFPFKALQDQVKPMIVFSGNQLVATGVMLSHHCGKAFDSEVQMSGVIPL